MQRIFARFREVYVDLRLVAPPNNGRASLQILFVWAASVKSSPVPLYRVEGVIIPNPEDAAMVRVPACQRGCSERHLYENFPGLAGGFANRAVLSSHTTIPKCTGTNRYSGRSRFSDAGNIR
jgi:hypothetical protein